MSDPQVSPKAARLHITGRVQGVGYRAWTIRAANARGLSGWVRNRADGSVEVLIAGPTGQVDDMIAACRKGPPLARVTAVETGPALLPAEPGFRHLPTI
jgi:acylphosphatase